MTCIGMIKINSSPYEEGWMIKVKPSSPSELDSLLGPKEYTKFCEEEDAAH
jgi:glycine cleavage system H protein